MPSNYANGHTLRERLLSRLIIDPSGCVLWAGSLNRDGYGQIKVGGSMLKVHRVAWEMFEGPVPEGFHIDHVRDRGCLNRHCAGIAHLEPVTPLENARRVPLHDLPLINAAKTRCNNGHRYTPQNTYRTPDGRRDCRACIRDRVARYRGRRATP